MSSYNEHVRRGVRPRQFSLLRPLRASWLIAPPLWYFSTHSVLTRRQFENLCMLKRATAARYIARLVKEKKLCNISIPHNPIYEPMPGCYGKEKLPEPANEPTGAPNEQIHTETI